MLNGKTHYFDWAIFNSKLFNHQGGTSQVDDLHRRGDISAPQELLSFPGWETRNQAFARVMRGKPRFYRSVEVSVSIYIYIYICIYDLHIYAIYLMYRSIYHNSCAFVISIYIYIYIYAMHHIIPGSLTSKSPCSLGKLTINGHLQ